MAHWMTEVVKRAGFDGADRLILASGAPIEEAWSKAAAVCGVGQRALMEAVADRFRIGIADLSDAEPTATKLLPASVARRFHVFPIRDLNRYLVVAVSDPTDPEVEQEVGFSSGRTPSLRIAPPDAITRAIETGYSEDAAVESLLATVDTDADGLVELTDEPAPEVVSVEELALGPIVSLANIVLDKAITQGASDIHIQPTANQGVVRFRVDGVLRSGMRMPLPILTRVISRIKIMGNMDITDRLRAQDGRAGVRIRGRDYDLRISTVPTRRAEKAVIRILDSGQSGSLEDAGIPERDLGRIRKVLSHRDGIFIVTGPTGSGKTTTLYSALREIATDDVNIMTVEDPVEYELPGLTQIQVEHAQGMTFASALKAILRQDPDVIFVGEIRDLETAEIAAQASLTGHLVLATLHTNDAVGSIRRFTDLGLDRGTVTETLRGVLAQRLMRTVCPDCSVRVGESLTPEEQSLSTGFGVRPTVRAVGCEQCGGQGYLGRVPITEFMTVSDDLVRLILQGAAPFELKRQAATDGLCSLLESALERVSAGQTTLEEVERVVGGGDATPSAQSQQAPAPPPMARTPAPAPQPTAHVEVAFPTPPHAPESDDAPPHILVVDDDGTSRTIARALLEKDGYRVSEAADGSEGLALLSKGEEFDLMILDLDMPLLGGRDVLRVLRGAIATAALPVIVLTGTPDPEAEVEVLSSGADDYMRKPLEPTRFLLRIKAVLRRARG